MRIPLSRSAACILAAFVVAGCAADDGAGDVDAMDTEAGTDAAAVPDEVDREMMEDWNVRLDREGADRAGFGMVTADEGFAVRTGPAGIAWRAVDLAEEGDFTASATFTERGAPADHREAYGILVGGQNLDGPDQMYTYFLVRGDGSYLIKRRDGSSTSNLVGWTRSDAVSPMEEGEEANPNTLAVGVEGDEVGFMVNGTVVETLPVDEVQPYGFAGIRVNHNLDVAVSDWTVAGAEGQMEGDGM